MSVGQKLRNFSFYNYRCFIQILWFVFMSYAFVEMLDVDGKSIAYSAVQVFTLKEVKLFGERWEGGKGVTITMLIKSQ